MAAYIYKFFPIKLHILLSACLCQFSVSAQAVEDLLVFPEVRAVSANDVASSSDIFAIIDFFGSASYGQFRLLGEVVLTEDDVEAERLQLGYEFSGAATGWLGRFHNPLGFWNTQFHHGTYLQTSISRPEIAKLEHNGGLFPSHITGVLLETTQNLNDGASLDFSFAAGTSPELRANTGQTVDLVLHPMEVFNPKKGDHRLNLTAQAAYRSGGTYNNQLGTFISNVEISVAGNSVKKIDLSIAGLFAYWEKQNFNAYSALFFAKDRVETGLSTRTGSFSSGYVQLDYLLQDSWVLFARVEDTFGDAGDPYFELMTQFSPETQVAGIRWDITYTQSLKFEISSRESTGINAGESYTSTLLNWSAVFP
ncbi:hypothetical protein MNBD_GAMMA11-2129 [hydrothermal vent metagenome]|uniref:Uncharacterized protein n=1 Tax=hydrothermal vent metagenome TaxID=652676 RepID=A0A3B0XA19_9ZZZZ